ncbi:MAG: hypothetical protein ACP5O1_07090 [Phycisphaerae bacterium]
MQPYHLAKIINWAPDGELRSRKRMQKIIFLLQSAGCAALDADFILHHYGPYSQDVAALTDQMVSAELLVEKEEPTQLSGSVYSYRLSETVKSSLEKFEGEETGKRMAEEMEAFRDRAVKLIETDLRELEYAATAIYFRRHGADWNDAWRKTAEFKKIDSSNPALQGAVELAKQFAD